MISNALSRSARFLWFRASGTGAEVVAVADALLPAARPRHQPAVAPADKVAPGGVVTYTWLVPERAGPGPRDLSSVMWMYHSHVNEASDPYAGLFGAIIITTPDNANDDGTPKDVDRCGAVWCAAQHAARARGQRLPLAALLLPCARCAVLQVAGSVHSSVVRAMPARPAHCCTHLLLVHMRPPPLLASAPVSLALALPPPLLLPGSMC